MNNVMKTLNYDLFKFYGWNREIDQNHVKNLIRSIKEHDKSQITPILIDSKMYILDGQHRFEALKQLQKPIYYQIVHLDESDVFTLNNLTKKWSNYDKLKFKAKMGNKYAAKALELIKEYNIIPSLLWKITRTQSGCTEFDELEAEKELKILTEIRTYLPKRFQTRTSFIAIIDLIRLENFNKDVFIKKLFKYSGIIEGRSDAIGFLDEYKKLYNYRSSTNKI